MKTIKFKTTEFQLVNTTVTASRFQASIVKGNKSVDDIINEATGSNQIKIYENGETVALYNGYSKLFVVTFLKGADVGGKKIDLVSVEMINEDIQSQLDALNATVNSSIKELKSAQNAQADKVNSVASTVSELVQEQANQSAAIDDIGTAVNDLAEGNTPVTLGRFKNEEGITEE